MVILPLLLPFQQPFNSAGMEIASMNEHFCRLFSGFTRFCECPTSNTAVANVNKDFSFFPLLSQFLKCKSRNHSKQSDFSWHRGIPMFVYTWQKWKIGKTSILSQIFIIVQKYNNCLSNHFSMYCKHVMSIELSAIFLHGLVTVVQSSRS